LTNLKTFGFKISNIFHAMKNIDKYSLIIFLIIIMKSYKINPVTIDELNKWKSNSSINPRTRREISNTGNVFKYLEKEYIKHIDITKNEIKVTHLHSYKLEESVDDKDPVSFTKFWILEDNKKKIIYSDLNNLILYKDSHGLVRCFEKVSLEYLKAYNITKHPVNGDEIPDNIFKMCSTINLLEELKNKTIKEKAFDVFQKFSKISLFGIDYQLFLNLNKNQLIKFNFELKDFYSKNLTVDQRKLISIDDLLSKNNKEISSLTKEEIIEYLLNQIDILLNVDTEGLLYMIKSILVGALQLVIPEIKNEYNDNLIYDF